MGWVGSVQRAQQLLLPWQSMHECPRNFREPPEQQEGTADSFPNAVSERVCPGGAGCGGTAQRCHSLLRVLLLLKALRCFWKQFTHKSK